MNSSDSALRASSFALRATTGQDDGTRRMGSILPCCLPCGKAGRLQILCCQGFEVNDYNFTLDALALKPSGFCNVRVSGFERNLIYSKSKTWSCGPPARRSCGSESQVRDDRLCHRSNLFMVSGARFQVSVKIESWILNTDRVATEGQHR